MSEILLNVLTNKNKRDKISAKHLALKEASGESW